MESYEGNKLKQISIALGIRYKTGDILGARVATMKCKGPMAAKSQKLYPLRTDTREAAFRSVVQNVARVAKPCITIASDAKPSYGNIIKGVIPDAVHTPYKRPKRKKKDDPEIEKGLDPLYRLNHMAAMLRADISRLARRTWAASKMWERLEDHLSIYIAFNNHYSLF